ncbi:MerR family transcriptional regulator, partial [Candidatus Daviesbacteria bacterium]|nr:MerR family transcriptional regulator [Candidatus Daviesbacteria bacterium]
MKNSLLKIKNLLRSIFGKIAAETTPDFKQKKLVLISEAAKVLGVSIDTVRRWDKKGILHSERIDGKNRYFSISDLEKIKFTQPLAISQVSKQLDISQSTLRRMEEKGLIKPSRNGNGERLYSRQALEKFLNSEYFLRQKKVESKILQPLIKGDTEKTREPSTQKILTMLQQETSENVSRLLLFRKAFFASGLFLIVTLILLVGFITVSFILFPFETARFFGYIKKSSTTAIGQHLSPAAPFLEGKVIDESSRVLAVQASSAPGPQKAQVLGVIFKPVSRISLQLVKQISPETYRKIIPSGLIEDVNDILTINSSGDIETLLKLTFPDTSYFKIPDTGLVQNLNADFLRGKIPGSSEGDIAVLGKGGVIKGLIDQIGVTDIKSSSARLTVKTSDKVSTLSLDLASLSGDIEEVGAGSGLTGGGVSGSVTLKIGAGTGITVNDDDIAINQAFTPTWSGLHTFSSATPIALSATSPSISIGNTGSLSITDGSNTLLTLVDNGTTGNVGIGTSSPSNPLTVVGNANITGALTVSSCTGCGGSGGPWNDYTSTIGLATQTANVGIGTSPSVASAKVEIQGNANSTALAFLTHNLANSVFGLAVLDNGNVGVGTTAPNFSFQVAATANFGNVGIGGSLVTSGNIGVGQSLSVTDLAVFNKGLRVNGFSDLTGNVGIGSSLTVSSTGAFTLLGQNCSTLANGGKLTTDSAGNVYCSADSGGSLSGGVTNLAAIWQSSSTLGVGIIYDSGANVGIGTSSPLGRFDVRGGGNGANLNLLTYGTGVTNQFGLAVTDAGNVGIGYTIGPANGLAVFGNVGIGITTANSALTVNGGVSIGSGFNVVAPTDGLLVQGNVGIGTTATGAGLVTIAGSVGIGYTGTSVGTFPNLGLAVFGNVGIGTTSPNGSLEISSGQALFPTGTASLPSLTFGDDPDTGVWRPAANTLAFSTGGTERIRIDSSGNTGIGITPTKFFHIAPPATTGSPWVNIGIASGTYNPNGFTAVKVDLASNTNTVNSFTYQGINIIPDTAANTNRTITQYGFNVDNGSGAASSAITASSTGINTWAGYNVLMPNINQTNPGTITSSGMSITTGTITNGGTQNGINISASGVGAGTLTGLNIGGITAGTGRELGVMIGSGWDTAIG